MTTGIGGEFITHVHRSTETISDHSTEPKEKRKEKETKKREDMDYYGKQTLKKEYVGRK